MQDRDVDNFGPPTQPDPSHLALQKRQRYAQGKVGRSIDGVKHAVIPNPDGLTYDAKCGIELFHHGDLIVGVTSCPECEYGRVGDDDMGAAPSGGEF